MIYRTLFTILLTIFIAGCSEKKEVKESVNTAATPDQLKAMISGLKAYHGKDSFMLRGASISGLKILSTNEIVAGTNYSFSITFLYPYPPTDGVMHEIEAEVPFETMNQSQWFDRIIVRKIN